MTDRAPVDHRRYLYSGVVEQIQGLIRRGELRVGDKIPPERTLAEKFGVSRTCIRQAVQALAEQRVLESRQGDGTYVRAPDPVHLASAFAFAIEAQKETLHDIVEFRLMLEPQIARLAARNITPGVLDRLKVIVCDQQRKVLASEEDAGLDAAFHRCLAEAAGNRIIQKVVQAMDEILNESRSKALQSDERSRASLMGHFKILDALEKKDGEMAFEAMREHLLTVEQMLFGSRKESEGAARSESD